MEAIVVKKKEMEEAKDDVVLENVILKNKVFVKTRKTEGEKMEIDTAPPSVSFTENKNSIPKKEGLDRIKLERQEDGLTQLTIDGVEDDDDEEPIIMSKEEVHYYLAERISEHLKNPKLCKILWQRQRSEQLLKKAQVKYDDYSKLMQLLDMLYQKQVTFFHHIGLLPPLQYNNKAVSVDFPILPSAIAEINKSKMCLLKQDLPGQSETKVPTPVQTPTPVNQPNSTVSASTKLAIIAKAASNCVTKEETVECIDLTDEPEESKTGQAAKIAAPMMKHPAPLPPKPVIVPNKALPNLAPKPQLDVCAQPQGIVLQWDMPENKPPHSGYAKVSSFDIFGYQENLNVPVSALLWKKIGNVKAMELPMACTLTQFVHSSKYYFAIRAIDVHNRIGAYSEAVNVVFKKSTLVKKE